MQVVVVVAEAVVPAEASEWASYHLDASPVSAGERGDICVLLETSTSSTHILLKYEEGHWRWRGQIL